MANFAQLDENNFVINVAVVADEDTSVDGVEQEAVGAAFMHNLVGGNWIQTSYNGRIRKNFASFGYTYDPVRDAFIPPKPYPSWILIEETCRWEAPKPHNKDGRTYSWDEQYGDWYVVTTIAEVP
jgi:hypothetical protein